MAYSAIPCFSKQGIFERQTRNLVRPSTQEEGISDVRIAEEIIARGLPRVAPNTITDPNTFRAELQKVRAQGFAFDDLEFHNDMRCVAVPVFDKGNLVRSGICLSGPSSRYTLSKLSELVELGLVTARELSRQFEASP